MFFKGSRYKELPEMSAIDTEGQAVRSKTVRWIPHTPGTFQHTVNQADRLDLLAHKYYGDPKKWWLICDANPEFAMPTDLLNRHPIVQEIFIFEPLTGEDKWPLLIGDLKNLRGMREVYTDGFKATLEVSYNAKELDRKEIENVITANGFVIKIVSKKERVGQKITIPPNKIV